MSKLLGKSSPGVVDGTRTVTYSNFTTRLTPTSGVASEATFSQAIGEHGRSGTLKSHSLPLHPLPYRVFAGSHRINDFDMVLREPASPTFTYRYHGKANPGEMTMYWATQLSGGIRVPDVSGNLVNQATTEALNNLQDVKTNALVSIAEARKSFDFIAGTVSKILRSYRYAKRGRWSQATNILLGRTIRKNSSASVRGWLSWQFAVMPMLADIQGAFSLAHQGLKDAPIVAGRRYVSRPYGLPPWPFGVKEWTVDGRCEVGAEVCIRAKLSSPVISLLGQMGLYNPFAFAWELLPYSFVIDWLIPVGNALEALTATQGLVFYDGYVNRKTVTDFKWSCYRSSRTKVKGTNPSGHVMNVCQQRTTLVDFPYSRLYIKSPFSTSHVISALALVSQSRKW